MNFKTFDYVKHRKKFFIGSSVFAVVGIILLLTLGLNLGIDFSSGSRVDIRGNQQLSTQEIKNTFAELGYEPESLVVSGNNQNIITAMFDHVFDKGQIAEIKNTFKEATGIAPAISTVTPKIGKMLAENALWAIAISSVFIIIYVSIRFEFLQGLAAVLALLHDAFFIVAAFSLLQIEVNIVFIAAVLTIVGYSINDTIVTFDRIRENTRVSKKKLKSFEDFARMANLGVQQTIVRSVNTVVTVIIATVALLIFGSPSIWAFSLALLLGLLSGMYSSIFIAAPIWAVWKYKWVQRQLKKKQAQPQS